MVRALLLALILTAAAYDWKYRRIPNWLTFGGVFAGLAVNTYLLGPSGTFLGFGGAALALIVYLPLFALRAMGAGDAKLMAAIGALIGPFAWFSIFIYTALIGGVIALASIIITGRFQKTLRNIGTILSSLTHAKRPWTENPDLDVSNKQAFRLPHAIPIAAAVIVYLAFGPLR